MIFPEQWCYCCCWYCVYVWIPISIFSIYPYQYLSNIIYLIKIIILNLNLLVSFVCILQIVRIYAFNMVESNSIYSSLLNIFLFICHFLVFLFLEVSLPWLTTTTLDSTYHSKYVYFLLCYCLLLVFALKKWSQLIFVPQFDLIDNYDICLCFYIYDNFFYFFSIQSCDITTLECFDVRICINLWCEPIYIGERESFALRGQSFVRRFNDELWRFML